MKKLFVLLALFALITVGLTACQPKSQFITVATGGTGGPYNIIGANIAELFNQNIKNIQASASVTNASNVNVGLLQDKKA
ncbi:MAG: TAXI family TRAP transporter solute-binding subunit, partial [Bacillota bacterium]|nr:TAXI family TRAP transporter solute-binding subunit [Bacillota bacterium]